MSKTKVTAWKVNNYPGNGAIGSVHSNYFSTRAIAEEYAVDSEFWSHSSPEKVFVDADMVSE